MSTWNVSTRNDNSVGRVEAATKAKALALARRLYGGKGERNWLGRPTKQAVYVQQESGNPTRRNPGTKAERAVASQKLAAKRRIAVALAKYLKQQNPAAGKLAGAKIEKLKGGVLKITPIRANAGGKRAEWRACSYCKRRCHAVDRHGKPICSRCKKSYGG